MTQTGAKQHLIVVANSGEARFFSRQRDTDPLTPLPAIHSRHASPQGRDGHMNHGGGAGGVSLSPHTDPQHKRQMLFASQVSALVDRAIGDGACDELFIAASSPFLGELRMVLSEQARKRLTASIDMDLTSFGLTELERRLDGEVRNCRAKPSGAHSH
jgi:protein required for attachment to host cells